jgi:regulator of protease activity HflC (stomatin/prohibitin superfamily)
MPVLVVNLALMVAALAVVVYGAVMAEAAATVPAAADRFVAAMVTMGGGILYLAIIGPIIFLGLKVVRPNEALVLTLFGKYYGTVKAEGFFFVHPFVSPVNPFVPSQRPSSGALAALAGGRRQAISLKAETLNNDQQKVNDKLGNPVIIGVVVIWKVVNTAKALFNVENYKEFLSIQCDAALRNIVRDHPYDTPGDEGELSLRGSSQEVADQLRAELQTKVEVAGLEILEARITHLSYAPEIAAAMLQRQQARAMVDARQLIVEGAVGMVEMALAKLNENDIVRLDEERKAAMVSNLLVVLCANRDAQPVVNSGTLY